MRQRHRRGRSWRDLRCRGQHEFVLSRLRSRRRSVDVDHVDHVHHEPPDVDNVDVVHHDASDTQHVDHIHHRLSAIHVAGAFRNLDLHVPLAVSHLLDGAPVHPWGDLHAGRGLRRPTL